MKLVNIEILTPGQRLKALRKQFGLKQEDLECKNLSKNYISMFENDKRRINIISATYLASKINEIARQKGSTLNIAASYFIKNESDVARDICLELIEKSSSNSLNSVKILYTDLYKVLMLSHKYEFSDLYGEALYLKGFNLYKAGLYNCAISNFSQSLLYFVKEGNNEGERKVYLNMAKTYYMKKDYKLSLTYFNLTGYLEESEDINYYKALCYYRLKRFDLAKNLNSRIVFKDSMAIELENSIERALEK